MKEETHTMNSNKPIAIIGMGCRFPGGADNPPAFWKMLCEGVDAVDGIPPDRWNVDRFYHPDAGRMGKHYTRRGGFIKGIDLFDAGFFGISPREAAHMDPQQRILLEVVWEAMEDGAQRIDRKTPTNAGVFIGVSSVDYSVVLAMLDDLRSIEAQTATGTSRSIVANRISHAFNFTGPSVAIDTACSSSLVALHLACTSIQNGECDLALAGGAQILLNPRLYIAFSRLSMLSPEGKCRMFDAQANGYVRGEGIGVVVLKPLDKALADGNPIYATIIGTGVNQDGHTPGITVPNGSAQEALLRKTYAQANIDPLQISYMEAHGTGTAVGDPIEAGALSRSLCEGRPLDAPLYIGSVKTNIGHLESSAGIAGTIKVALMLRHGKIPANLNLEEPNPAIDFEQLRIRVPQALIPWPKNHPRIAGVNSFGFGGTNAFALLAAVPEHDDTAAAIPFSNCPHPEIVCISARDESSLADYAKACLDFAGGDSWDATSLYEISRTSCVRRFHHGSRLSIVVNDKDELRQRLETFCRGEASEGVAAGKVIPPGDRKIAFVFSGQGPQWWAMGRQLLSQEAVFRETIEKCDALLQPYAGWSLLAELKAEEADSRMALPAIAQPAIFALQMALTALWDSWGIHPNAVVGHSVGEAAAACVGGTLSLEDALRVIFHRGRCMQLAPATGRMLAVGLDPVQAAELVQPFSEFAAIGAFNSPESVTLTGDADVLARIENELCKRDIFCRFLAVNYAFHSSHMDGIRDEIVSSLKGITTDPARLTLYSTVSGSGAGREDFACDYWWKNVRFPVRFSDAIAGLIGEGCTIFVEISPHPVLSGSIAECSRKLGASTTVLHSLNRRQPERFAMLNTLGALHGLGAEIRWDAIFSRQGAAAPFPGYAWKHTSYWQQSEECHEFLKGPFGNPLLGRRQQSPVPTWESKLSELYPDFLRDHAIRGAVLLPATAFLELALAAAAASGYEAAALEDIKLLKPVFLSRETDCILHTVCNPDEGTFSIHSRAENSDVWQLHVTGTILAGLRATPPSVDVEALAARFGQRSFSAHYYDSLRKSGYEFGPSFRCISELYFDDRQCLGRIDVPEPLQRDLAAYQFHPAVFDACLQVSGQLTNRDGIYLPVGLKRVRVFEKPQSRLWSYVYKTETAGASVFFSLHVLNEGGRVVAEVDGMEVRQLQETRRLSAAEAEELLYEYRWVPQLRSGRAEDRTTISPGEAPAVPIADLSTAPPPGTTTGKDFAGSWLIFNNKADTGQRLARKIESFGGRTFIVSHGACYKTTTDREFEIRDDSREDMHLLLENTLFSETMPPFRGVLYLWSFDTVSADALTEADLNCGIPAMCISALHLIQEMMDHGHSNSRVWLITRGATSPLSEPDLGSVSQAPLWGLGRVIGNEYASTRCTLVDLGSDSAESDSAESDSGEDESVELHSLIEELRFDGNEEELAFRGTERYVRRMEKGSLAAGRESLPAVDGIRHGFRLECSSPGSLESLRIRQMARRAPKEKEVEIEVHAAGLNFRDVMQALAMIPGITEDAISLGIECAGVISRTGSGVTSYRVGDRVLAFASHCLSSHVTVNEQLIVSMPESLSFAAGATIPAAFLTACFSLINEAKLQKGERVLIHSASGGVGLAAVQVAKHVGAEIFATAGSPEKREFLNRLGVEHVLDSRSLDFADQVLQLTHGEGVDVVLNSLAGEAIPKGLSLLRNKGRFVELGVRDMLQNKRISLQLLKNNISYFYLDLTGPAAQRPSIIGTGLAEVMGKFSKSVYELLPFSTFPFSKAHEAFRHMARAKHIGKIVLLMDDTEIAVFPSAKTTVRFREDASYLITGGFGGFGMLAARWMAACGAKHLVLLSRSGASSEEAREGVRALENAGVKAVAVRADAANEGELSRVIADFGKSFPPLKGIIHAAMVLDDCALINLNAARLTKVLDPKIKGAWHLHQLTREMPLDFFVLFSSCSSLLGLPGQGNYNSANAFLDALCWHRRSLGLTATTVNWGYLGSVGYAAIHEKVAAHFEKIGVPSFSPEAAVFLLGQILERKPAQISVLKIDWPRFLALSSTHRNSPRFSAFAQYVQSGVDAETAKTEFTNLRSALTLMSLPEAITAVENVLCSQIAAVLGAVSSGLDRQTPLTEYGLDSLMAVELRSWVESTLGVTLRTMDIMRGPTIRQLAENLVAPVKAAPGTAP